MKEIVYFESVIPLAHFNVKSKKTGNMGKQLASINNIPKWYRYKKTEIKNQYKQLLKDFFIPEPDDEHEILHDLILEYRILRHNKRKVDTDGLIFNHKWLSDLLQDMKWIKDDDQVTLIIRPSIYTEKLVETQMSVKAYRVLE